MKKKITIYLSILVCVIGVLILGIIILNKPKNDNPNLPIVDGTQVSDDVVDMPENIVFKKSAADSTLGDTITVRCNVVPDDAINKEVLWSLNWAAENNDAVTNYVSISPSSDTLSCTISTLKPFNTKINLTVCSKENPSITKTCVLDYNKRLTYDESTFNTLVNCNSFNNQTFHAEIGNRFIDFYNKGQLQNMELYSTESLDCSVVGTTGTTWVDVEVTYTFSEQFVNQFKRYCPSTSLSSTKTYTSGGDKVAESFEEFFMEIESEYSSNLGSFLKAMRNLDTVFTVHFKMDSMMNPSTVFKTYTVDVPVGKVNVDSLFAVTGLELDRNSYIF